MSVNLLKQAAANSAQQGREESAHEQAKIGAAAERKRREEQEASLVAAIKSGDSNGKAIRWTRRVSTPSGTQQVAMFERMGAYGEREFLRLANRAAAAAIPGGWKNGEAVEAIAAEIVTRVMAKTYGRMPKRGSLGTSAQSEDPDFSYLVSVGRFCAADALGGDDPGLSAEVAPMAAADGSAATSLADLAAESLAQAESAPERDAYHAEPISLLPAYAGPATLPTGDYVLDQVKGAASSLARECGQRPAAVRAAIVCALRPEVQAAEWADVGYAATAGALRKSASLGRGILRERLSAIPHTTRHWSAADWRTVEAVARISALETVERERQHQMEDAPPSYKAPHIPDWVSDPETVVSSDVRMISAEQLAEYPSKSL